MRAVSEGGFDEGLLTAKHPFRGLTFVIAFTRKVKKSMDRIADQLLTIWDIALAGFVGGKVRADDNVPECTSGRRTLNASKAGASGA